jgi:hypothetical protein
MSVLNLVLHPGHIYCRECLVQIPATFLFCPQCHGLVRVQDEWVAPESRSPPREPKEQQILLFSCAQE